MLKFSHLKYSRFNLFRMCLIESKDFNRTAAKVFKALLEIREKCDEARLDVIGKRSRLQMVETERNAAQLVLKALIKDKQDQLERLTQYHDSLLRCEKDKEETLMSISQT